MPEAMTRIALRQLHEQNRGRPPIEGQYVHYYDTEESDLPVPSTVNSRTIRHEWPTTAQNSSLHAWSTSAQQSFTSSNKIGPLNTKRQWFQTEYQNFPN